MFEFFKDVANEVWGVTTPTVDEKPKKEKRAFTRKAKCVVIILGVIYMVLAGSTVGMLLSVYSWQEVFFPVALYILLSGIDLFTVIMLLFGKERGERLAKWGIGIFVVLLLLSVYIM